MNSNGCVVNLKSGKPRSGQCQAQSAPLSLCWLAALLLLASMTALANDAQDHQALRTQVQTYLAEKTAAPDHSDVEIRVGQLDSRLRLEKCAGALSAFVPDGVALQGSLNVGVRCALPKPWTVYVPAEVRLYREVLAIANSLPSGAQITAADVVAVRMEISRLRSGYFSQKEQVIGKELTRAMTAGEIFQPNRLKSPLLVRRGEDVMIVASTGGLEVRSRGKAMADASEGQVLNVRNLRSNRTIQAIAVKPGVVMVSM